MECITESKLKVGYDFTFYEGCSIIRRRFSHILSDSTKESKTMIQSSRLYSNNGIIKHGGGGRGGGIIVGICL